MLESTQDSQQVEGENSISPSQFRLVAQILFEEAGITMPESKISLVNTRLSKRLRAIRMQSFKDYCNLLQSPQGQEERHFLITALTTNTTKFFREPHHFDIFKDFRLPKLLATARSGGKVRLWSAACSSGEEPYTLAMTILSEAPDIARYDFKILATDIDTNILARAKSGVYSKKSIANLTPDQKRTFFSEINNSGGEEQYQVKPNVRDLITFKQMNLTQPWPVKGPFNDIFCRNVVIYFSQETSEKVWINFASKLEQGGNLYIGHSERITGPALPKFEVIGITTYKRI